MNREERRRRCFEEFGVALGQKVSLEMPYCNALMLIRR